MKGVININGKQQEGPSDKKLTEGRGINGSSRRNKKKGIILMKSKEKFFACIAALSRFKKPIVAGIVAFSLALSPLQATITAFADEIGDDESKIEEVQSEPEETNSPSSEKTVTEPSAAEQSDETTAPTETYEQPDYSDYAEPEKETEETTETTVEPELEETVPETAVETEVTAESTAPSEETAETTFSESEVTEPTIEEKTSNIVFAKSSDEYFQLIADLPDSTTRLVVETKADLSELKVTKGVYFDGTYILYFDNQNDFLSAIKTISDAGYEYAIDGKLSVCGSFDSVITYGNVNPSAKVKVAVIDTGSNLANEKYSVIGSDVSDHNGHGTAMCSYVLDETSDAYIISIKAISDNGMGNITDVYAAVQLAEDLGVDYILMAIAIRDSGKYDAFESLIKNTKAKVVASAGNNGADASKYLPAGLKGVITVGAIDDENNLRYFSNYGACVEYYVAADSTSEASAKALGKLIKGEFITSVAFKNDNNTYFYKGSEEHFELNYTTHSTKYLEVMTTSDMNGYTREQFRNRVLNWCSSNTGYTIAGGCIDFVLRSYEYARSGSINGHFTSGTGFPFNHNNYGTNSFMRAAGYGSSSNIGLTGLYVGSDIDKCIVSGRAFYNFVTANAEPGDIIFLGDSSSGSNAWRHTAIYWKTGSESFGGNAQPGIWVYESPGTGQSGRTRFINAADFRITNGISDSKAFSSVLILKVPDITVYPITVVKTSANTAIVSDNDCYSMEGTTYGLYKKDGTLVHTYTLDAEGKTTEYTPDPSTDGLEFYIQEIAAGRGYELDDTKYDVDFSSAVNNLVTVSVEDVPIADPISWSVKKVDPYNWNLATEESLAGAVFRMDYYDRTDIRTVSDIALLDSDTPKATATLTTSAVEVVNGHITIDIDTLAAANSYFASFSSLRELPLGTYRITETSAPTGYSIADPSKPLVFYIYDNDGTAARGHIGDTTIYNEASSDEIIMKEQPQLGFYAPTKNVASGSSVIVGLHSLNGTQYGVYYKSNDKLVATITFNAAGNISNVVYAAGITPKKAWTSGNTSIEFPAGEYYAKELTAGRWFQLDSNSYEFVVTAGKTTTASYDDAAIPPPTIQTTATDSATGTHYLSYTEKVTINDVVKYEGLVTGESYTVVGTLYNAATGEIYKDPNGKTYTQTVVFTPSTANGTTTVVFKDVLVPFTKTQIVVFESLYENQNNVLIVAHEDLKDEGQTVERRVPDLQTTATDTNTGTHYLSLTEKVDISDKVSYTNLNPGEEYKTVATLYNAATGEIYKDPDGKTYTQTVVFTPSTADGTVTVAFTGVLVPLEKTTIVIFEDLYENSTSALIATHADLKDEGQTVERRVPELHTTASDVDNGTHTLTYKERVSINDEVTYTNLNPGEKYKTVATLYNAATGEIYKDPDGKPYTQTVVFTPTESDGVVYVLFTDVYVPYEKTTIVVFEDLYDNTTNLLLATHADLTDKNQTVERASAGTTATVNNAKAVWLGTTEVQNITISDKIAYSGLSVGTLYRAEATLYKKDGSQLMAGGQPIVSIVEFTPEAADGEVVVKITFSTSGLAEGDQIVVFEKVYDVATEAEKTAGTQTEDLLIAKHEDLNDKDQTITIHFRPMTGGIVPSYSVVGALIAIAATVIAGAWFFISRKKKIGEA